MSIAFLAMLAVSCQNKMLVCVVTPERIKIPTISDIIALPIFDRIFTYLNTLYFIGIHQVNVRSYYKTFNDIGVPSWLNDALLYCGLIPSITSPLIGIFDWRNFHYIHYGLTGTFFFCASAYYFGLA